ncbi:MAG: caspase family protein, partial [Proteobacteria bacterium]|nr:caspase family protein [Pseudomonadota bacterium]
MKKLLLILLCLPLLVIGQTQKRLALVIGNSDYQYLSKLPNPVGDAQLIAETLDSLGFEVMLETNIRTKREFINKIIEFGERRDSFEVGFIYYAGHGMQVDGKNYLLPTGDTIKTEEDVRQYTVGVETLMQYLTKRTDQVNVLILDACRDNPLKNTRGGGKGGLAEMQAKGSLIAFSTIAGNVADDGDGNHSVYCMSLAKNMLIEGISLDQVFRNVRKEVMEITGQGTVNYDQLTGDPFYLVKSNFEKQFTEIDSLVDIG